MATVVCLGELLIDFVSVCSGVSVGDAPAFEKKPGGAPANVAVGVEKLGTPSAFIGMVGNDEFGHFLARTLDSYDVDISGLKFTTDAKTTLAFVSLKENGERSFIFYRDPGADMLFSKRDIEYSLFQDAKIFHFGSITLISEPARTATITLADYALKNGLIVSYDPNLRLSLWKDENAAREGIQLGLKYANVLKLSREEVEFLTNIVDIEEGCCKISAESNLHLIVATLGAQGCYCFYQGKGFYAKPYRVNAIDTTGAGDGFMAGLLHSLCTLDKNIRNLDENTVYNIMDFGNKVGAYTTLKKGAIPALPYKDELNSWQRTI